MRRLTALIRSLLSRIRPVQSPPAANCDYASAGDIESPPGGPTQGVTSRFLGPLRRAAQTSPISFAWSLFLSLGSLIFFIYYAQAGYLPEFDLGSATSLLIAAALTGCLYVVVLVAVLIWPAIFWLTYVRQSGFFQPIWRDGSDPERQSAKWFVLAFVPTHLVLLYATNRAVGALAFGLLTVATTLAWGAAVWLYRRLAWGVAFPPLHKTLALMALGTFCWFGFIFAWIFALELGGARDTRLDIGIALAITFGLLLVLGALNVIAVMIPRGTSPFVWVGGVGAMVLAMTVFNFDLSSNLSAFVMRKYGWGNIADASLVLNREGCAAVSYLGIVPVDYQGGDVCRVDRVRIVSRLGANYYLEAARPRGGKITFTLPSADVISYAPSADPTTMPTPRATPSPAPTAAPTPPSQKPGGKG